MAGYGDDDTFTTWLADNGYALPDGAPTKTILRQRGAVYIDGYEDKFLGTRTAGYSQERSWPRKNVVISGESVPDDVVPLPVIYASFEAALQEAREPESLSIIGSAAGAVKSERVEGAVEVEYQASGAEEFAYSLRPIMTVVEGMLAPFLYCEVEGSDLGILAIGGSSGDGGCSGQTV